MHSVLVGRCNLSIRSSKVPWTTCGGKRLVHLQAEQPSSKCSICVNEPAKLTKPCQITQWPIIIFSIWMTGYSASAGWNYAFIDNNYYNFVIWFFLFIITLHNLNNLLQNYVSNHIITINFNITRILKMNEFRNCICFLHSQHSSSTTILFLLTRLVWKRKRQQILKWWCHIWSLSGTSIWTKFSILWYINIT